MVKEAYKTIGLVTQILPKIYCLSVDFKTTELSLDNVRSVPELILKVETDQLLSASIDKVVHCLIASLFYFKLDLSLKRYNWKYIIIKHIMCSIRCNDLVFKALFSKLLAGSVRFWVNDWPMLESINDPFCFGKDWNFWIQVYIEMSNRFTMSLKQGEAKAYNISGLFFFVKGLVAT